ncbi:dCTP deaminase [Roseobacter weihaiensis]|uniref:dCTP deaminase n=1 Tax=Roseobacter weihaiensis TaxID=2763262 RepID=UPI001D0B7D5B|nr:hypothetical protein [Roseobacter sp. H9]
MLLTGGKIHEEVCRNAITISDFDENNLEPNSYGFRLGEEIIVYDEAEVDGLGPRRTTKVTIPEHGYVLEPDRFYLGHTYETMGSNEYASEIYARLSTSALGIFIQTSAPLGHTGAIVKWTLEIVVAQHVIAYPKMLIGKICFWENTGEVRGYAGRYAGSQTVIPSLLSAEAP